MITIRKLQSLGMDTRLRKAAAILQEYENKLQAGMDIDAVYLKSLMRLLLTEKKIPESFKKKVTAKIAKMERILSLTNNAEILCRDCNDIKHGLLKHLGAEPADWDFIIPETGKLDADKRMILPAGIFLEDIRSPYNVGSIFRTAESFGVEKIFITEEMPKPTHKRAQRTSMGCCDVVPWEVSSLSCLGNMKGVFALEVGGIPIDEFVFPEEGIVIIGSEELGVSPAALKISEKQYKTVSIPLSGVKASLNVSVAFGILMHYWYLFLLRRYKDTCQHK